MPTFGVGSLLRRAVQSIVSQSVRDWLLVIISDADPGAFDCIADIRDERVLRFTLTQRRGRYFADAVALAACREDFFTVHDSDDWSDPTRLERLLARATSEVDVVFGGYRMHREDGSTRDVAPTPEMISGLSALRHVAHHTALFRTEALRRIGGPHPGYRVSYDTFMIDVAVLALKWAVVREPLYHYGQRKGSLVSDRRTGMHSPYRQKIRAELANAWKRYRLRRELPSVPPALRGEVAADAERLSRLLGGERAVA